VVFVTALNLGAQRGGISVSQAHSGAGKGSMAQAACWILGAAAVFVGLMPGV